MRKIYSVKRAGIAVAFASIFLALPASARYMTDRYRFGSGIADTTTHMRVERNTVCKQQMNSFSTKVIEEIVVVTRPKAGSAGSAGHSSWAYKPKPGYTGPDSFVVQVNFSNNGSRFQTKIAVTVDVVDHL